ncbi:MAG TPA: hypothetical protein VLM40_13650, partial [Gemmata sp.]|nr:hypothetical protein [Gemmata sp.]
GRYYLNTGDHREALVQIRKARDLATLDYPGTIVLQNQLKELEAEARWENKLPAVLRGELKLQTSQEFAELASYCATFEKKYALATRFVIEGLKANPKFLNLRGHGTQYASWAVQAGFGRGADGAEISPQQREEFRRMALEWMKSFRVDKDLGLHFTAGREFAPVRDPKELARLPAAERAEWEKLWLSIVPPRPAAKKPSRELAPPPRRVKD